MNYFSITAYINGRKKALRGIRGYHTDSYETVYKIALQELLKYYERKDILKIDVWPMPEYSPEVRAYLERMNG
ncbi:MAG: hypothetical protein ABUT20_10130 [Bacteroidota bacterium]